MKTACGRVASLNIRSAASAFVIAIALLGAVSAAFAQQYNVDRKTSDALTAYLRENHLPLVGAQVTNGDKRRVVLYGFVASEHGKDDAGQKALQYLGSGTELVNRISIRPEIATMRHVQQDERANAPDQPDGGGPTFDQILDDIQHYGIKTAPAEAEVAVPP
jgi:hypothetical protein